MKNECEIRHKTSIDLKQFKLKRENKRKPKTKKLLFPFYV